MRTFQFECTLRSERRAAPVKVRSKRNHDYVHMHFTQQVDLKERVVVEITIDEDALGRMLAKTCNDNRTQKAQLIHNLIRATLVSKQELERNVIKEIPIQEMDYELVTEGEEVTK